MQHFSKIASIEMSLDVQFDTSMKPVNVSFKNSRKDTLALASLQFFWNWACQNHVQHIIRLSIAMWKWNSN